MHPLAYRTRDAFCILKAIYHFIQAVLIRSVHPYAYKLH